MYRKKLVTFSNVRNSNELRVFKSLQFERLSGDKLGLYSIRVNEKYGLEFLLNKEKDIVIEEIMNYRKSVKNLMKWIIHYLK